MTIYDDIGHEIAKVAYELYEKSGRINGRDLENWLQAEKIVLARRAKKEEPLVEESEEATVVEEIEVKEPIIAEKKKRQTKRPAVKTKKETPKKQTKKVSPKKKT